MEATSSVNKDIELLLTMVSDLYERMHRTEHVLITEGTLTADTQPKLLS